MTDKEMAENKETNKNWDFSVLKKRTTKPPISAAAAAMAVIQMRLLEAKTAALQSLVALISTTNMLEHAAHFEANADIKLKYLDACVKARDAIAKVEAVLK